MLDPFFISLGLRLVLAAAVVVVAAFLIERSGPFVGAMIVTLPISTGPAYAFLAMEHPPDFLAATALSSLVSNAATPVFMSVYALLAQRNGVLVSLGTALAAWSGLVACSVLVDWDLLRAIVLNVVLYALGGILLRGVPAAQRTGSSHRRWWDLPFRATAVMSLCAAVILAAHRIGPQAAGLVALAPMGFVSMALVVHPRAGGPVSASVFANALPGMIGFVGALLTVHVATVALGSWLGLCAALGVSMVWNGMLVLLKACRSRRNRDVVR